MDRNPDIERLIDATGVSLPLAARIVSVVLDSGASHVEVSTALNLVQIVLGRLPITFDHQAAELPDAQVS